MEVFVEGEKEIMNKGGGSRVDTEDVDRVAGGAGFSEIANERNKSEEGMRVVLMVSE